MNREPDFFENLRAELSGWRNWVDRAIVLAYAVAAGLCVVIVTIASEKAFGLFEHIYHEHWWAVLIWTPAVTAAIVWVTRRWFPGSAGSGIPQVKAAIDPALPPEKRHLFASLRLTLGKMALTVAGFLAGLSVGREGPSVQIAAGVLQHARRWMSPSSSLDTRSLLIAGGAAGIAAAFNAPLAGVVFAIEELSGRIETRASGLVITAILLSGLVAVSFFGNYTYFGRIQVPRLDWEIFVPGLLVSLVAGVAGGLFARVMIASLTNAPQRLNALRARYPIRFGAALGLFIAIIGLATGGATFGAGSEAVQQMLSGEQDLNPLYALLKFMATWLTAWSGVPGGIFAPSLSIGAGLGHGVAEMAPPDLAPALIAMGMAGFLAAVTQAPLTAFIIVMEMIDGHSMVLSLMAAAMIASLVSRMISHPLYDSLAEHMVANAISGPAKAEPPPVAAAPVEPTLDGAPGSTGVAGDASPMPPRQS